MAALIQIKATAWLSLATRPIGTELLGGLFLE
jgi:hypothetical protein